MNTFKQKLIIIKNDINKYQEVNASDLIEERLEKTLTRYLNEIENSYNNLREKKNLTLLRRLSK